MVENDNKKNKHKKKRTSKSRRRPPNNRTRDRFALHLGNPSAGQRDATSVELKLLRPWIGIHPQQSWGIRVDAADLMMRGDGNRCGTSLIGKPLLVISRRLGCSHVGLLLLLLLRLLRVLLMVCGLGLRQSRRIRVWALDLLLGLLIRAALGWSLALERPGALNLGLALQMLLLPGVLVVLLQRMVVALHIHRIGMSPRRCCLRLGGMRNLAAREVHR